MLEELHIAITYSQKVSIKLHNGEFIIGKVKPSTDLNRVKIQTLEGFIWLPIDDIKQVKRLVQLH